MKSIREIIHDTRDEISDIESLVLFSADTVDAIDHKTEDIKVKGVITLLWHINHRLQSINENLEQALKK